MLRTLTSLLQLSACLILALGSSAQAEDKKVDPTGKWTWTQQGRQGGQAREVTLTLKLEGAKLTGAISGRQSDTPIEEATLKGDEISFKITREFQGNKFVQKYSGKIAGDAIKGKIEFEREGETQSREWEAKRAKAS